MSCSTCDDLRRQLREAREEIEAWEAGARGDHAAWLTADRLARWRRVFGNGRPAAVLLLMMLVDKPDRLISPAQFIAASRGLHGTSPDSEPRPKVVSVHVYYARRFLTAAGSAARVQASWGQGWFMTPADAKLVRELVGEAV